MNLWTLFPEIILDIPGILYLPYIALSAYFVVVIIFVRIAKLRKRIGVFFFVTLVTSTLIFLTLGPSMGTVIIPRLLLGIILIPSVWFVQICPDKHMPRQTVERLILYGRNISGRLVT